MYTLYPPAFFHFYTQCDSATPTTVAPVSVIASSSKPILSTVPSQSPALTLPPLKQKTVIVKSKVPPPVPPRGSPKDRRVKKPDASPKGTPPSSGSYIKNHLNDKFLACPTFKQRTKRTLNPPLFGERRSPSCVEDWLAINDFGVPQLDDLLHASSNNNNNKNILPTKQIPLKTNILKRENSFSNSSIDVRSIIARFSIRHPNVTDEKKPETDLTASLKTVPSVKAEIAKLNKNDQKTLKNPIIIKNAKLKSNQSEANQNLKAVNQRSSVLNSLKPIQRKKRPAPRAEDIYRSSQEKQQIIKEMSTVEIRSSDDNYDSVIENFSLEGEFV